MNLKRCRDVVMPKWGHLVEIPAPHLELCSKHILVMDYLDGVKLVDGVRAQYARLAARSGRTLADLEEERKRDIINGTFKFRTIEEDRKETARIKWMIALHDTFMTLNPLRLCYNISLARLVWGPAEYYKTDTPIDLGRLLDILCRVHATELFHEGLFNGDPHPGNCL